MTDQERFMEKIDRLKAARRANPALTKKEVDAAFQEDGLTAAQMHLVYDVIFPTGEKPELSEEEKAYLAAYEEDIRRMKPEEPGERARLLAQLKDGTPDPTTLPRLTELYLPAVIAKAKEYRCEAASVDDLVEEGNISLMLALGETAPELLTEESALYAMEAGMRVFCEGMKKIKAHDQELVGRVQELDEAITRLTEELGRKVTIDELMDELSLTEREVQDILRLTGETPQEEQED